MSDAIGSAAASLAGNPEPAATPAVTQETPITTTPQDPGSWYAGAPPELAGLAEKKGWKGVPDALKSYAELEKAFSGDKIVLPKDANDEVAWSAVHDKLGRPKTAADYKFPETIDPNMAKGFAEIAYKAGWNQKQVDAAVTWNLAEGQKIQEKSNVAAMSDQSDAMRKLESEWGQNMPAEVETNRRAMRALGISVDEATKFMSSGGAEKFMRLLNLAGKSMREDSTAGLGNESILGFANTPNQAALKIQQLKDDPQWVARWRAGDNGAKATMDQLLKIKSGA